MHCQKSHRCSEWAAEPIDPPVSNQRCAISQRTIRNQNGIDSITRPFRKRFGVGAFVLPAIIWVACLWAPSTQAAIQFKDVTKAAGLANTTLSFGSSWGDYNGDRRPDLWVSNHWYGGSLYKNRGDGTFDDVTPSILTKGVDRHGAAWADYDNDGDQDLLILVGAKGGTTGIPNQFFINDKGLLKESAARLGLDYPLSRGRMPLWFDWDADGDLDVLLVNQRRSDKKAPTALFTQQAGRFSLERIPNLFPLPPGLNEFAQLALSNVCVPGIPVVVIDQRNDYPARIYGYDDRGFQNSTRAFGFPKIRGAVHDVAIADVDGDLVADFFLTRRQGYLKGKLYMQTPTGVKDATAGSGLENAPGNVESVVAADFDNDRDVDLYLVRSTTKGNLANYLFENLGAGRFRRVPNAGGAHGGTIGCGSDVTTVDFDEDGFIDLFVTNGKFGPQRIEGPNQLFRNLGNKNRWLEIDLVGTVSNRDGIGAQLIATVGGIDQLREQNGGVHAKCQNHSRIHFGCGAYNRVSKLVVYWPSGIKQTLNNLATNRVIRIVEPYSPRPTDPPDVIQAEDYDDGGQHVAYYDTTPGNRGGQYRSDDVDIWRFGASKYYVGATRKNEWLNYTVDLPKAGNYRLGIRLATARDSRRIHVEFDDVDVTGSLVAPNTGGWRAWQTLTTEVGLNSGRQIMRLVFERGGLNVDWISLEAIVD